LAYKAAEFAVKYRNLFGKDIIVDLVCFRRWGHNELDDPTFTQSQMYKIIHNRKSVPDNYEENIVNIEGLCSKDELNNDINHYRQSLEDALTEVNTGKYKIEPRNTYLQKQWSAMTKSSHTERSHWATGCEIDLLKYVGTKSVSIPNDFVSLTFKYFL
jgi:probable 2-oxoglutarate dehydrogenase E1 component DHKTD1